MATSLSALSPMADSTSSTRLPSALTASFDTTVNDHVRMYTAVRRRIQEGAFGVDVRLPQCFVKREEFERNPEYYGYCPVKMGERVMVHSDGVIRICSNLICSSFGS